MAVTTTGIWDALAEVEDPELPVAITDLGMVRSVTVEGTQVRVLLTPTFVGCPALEVIQARVRRRLLDLPGVEEAVVRVAYDEPWTLDRLTAAARKRLAAHGLSVPGASLAEPAECPFCGSTNTVLENPFGATLCRAIYYCRDCRNPIERFRPPGDSLPAAGR